MEALENVFYAVKQFSCVRRDPARPKPGKWKRRRIPDDAMDYADGGLEWIDKFDNDEEDEEDYYSDNDDESDLDYYC